MSIIAVSLVVAICTGPLSKIDAEKDCQVATVAITVGHKMCSDVRDVYLAYQKSTPGKHGYMICSAPEGDVADATIIPFEGQSDSIGYSKPAEPAPKTKAKVKGIPL